MLFNCPIEIGGLRTVIVVRQHEEARLSTTCFRARMPRNLAGNFAVWDDAYDMMVPDIYSPLVAHAIQSLGESKRNGRITIRYPEPIGWESTDDWYGYPVTAIEHFAPNDHWHGLRVKREWSDILAPLTNLVTIAYEVKYEGDRHQHTIILHTMYPGRDVGILDGDVSRREECVFFDWNHPGERL